jgi:hypothetical protein
MRLRERLGRDMRKLVLRLASIAVLTAGAVLADARVDVEAMPVAASRALHAERFGAAVHRVQFFHLGQPYCWYRYGWAGAGWYWCGYGTQVGVGWGGAYGWNGWVVPRSQRAAGAARGSRYRSPKILPGAAGPRQ